MPFTIMKNHTRKHILLCAGGTGGHIFPSVAFSQYLREKRISSTVITNNPDMFPAHRNTHAVPMIRFKGTFLKFLKQIWDNTRKALNTLQKSKPSHIVLFGSIYCLPTFLAYLLWRAQGKNCRLILHEQNVVLGRMHRLAQFFAYRVALSFPKTRKVSSLTKSRTHHTGNPIRKKFRAPSPSRSKDTYKVMIVGGSQGAVFFASKQFLKYIYQLDIPSENLEIFHQAPSPFVSGIRHFYRKCGITAHVQPFFHDMSDLLPQCHAIISRAGGSIIAEILETQTPAILVPYPRATDQHQLHNAQYLAKHAASFCIQEPDATPVVIGESLKSLLVRSKVRKKSISNMRKLIRKNSCSLLFQLCE